MAKCSPRPLVLFASKNRSAQIEAGEFEFLWPSLDGDDARNATEVVQQRLSVLKKVFSEEQVLALHHAGVLPVGTAVCDDGHGMFPELAIGSSDAVSGFERMLEMMRQFSHEDAKRNAARLAAVFDVMAELECVSRAPTEKAARKAKQLVHELIFPRRKLLPANRCGLDDVKAFSSIASVLSFLAHLIENGDLSDFTLLENLVSKLTYVPVMEQRAAVVNRVQEQIHVLYERLEPSPEAKEIYFTKDGASSRRSYIL